VITALVLIGCSGGGSESDAGSCELVCDINTESYTIEISCESGTMSTKLLDDQTQKSTYDPSGNLTELNLNLNHTRTYENTQNVYTIVGSIEIDLVNDNVNHDIEVTGGEFGDTPRICEP
jgi:YD repeat-containing protein